MRAGRVEVRSWWSAMGRGADPFEEFESSCMRALEGALRAKVPEAEGLKASLETPPDPKFGDLAYPCFEAARRLKVNPRELAEAIAGEARRLAGPPILEVRAEGPGYVNFIADHFDLARRMFEAVVEDPDGYGVVGGCSGTVIVEHTSGNPVHPLTAGTGRNAFIGDALARLLRARGYDVEAHFYVDDVGFQVALAAYAYSKVRGKVEARGKPDHFVGLIYSIANALMEVQRLKREAQGEGEEAVRARSKLAEWASVLNELRQRDEELFNLLVEELRDVDLRGEALKLARDYEEGKPSAVKLVRELCGMAVEGFKQTLERANVHFDSWDWESELTVWSGAVEEVLDRLRSTPFVVEEQGALVFKVDDAAKALNVKPHLGVREDHEIPELTLTRADGTTLYTTRDIAYALWKLRRADKVINVIGAEQSLAQLQLKVALYLLGVRDAASRYVHYAYELVQLPGQRMSSRRGRYVALDQVMDEAVRRVYEEVDRRWPRLPEEEKWRVAERLGVGAVRYALISVSPSKPMVFEWDKVVNFERNSLPFINYAYVRSLGILRKAGFKPEVPDASKLTHPRERDLVMRLCRFPRTVRQAADELRPELLAGYLNDLSVAFNSYYEEVDVIHEADEEVRRARLALVDAVRVVLGNGMRLLGIEPVELM